MSKVYQCFCGKTFKAAGFGRHAVTCGKYKLSAGGMSAKEYMRRQDAVNTDKIVSQDTSDEIMVLDILGDELRRNLDAYQVARQNLLMSIKKVAKGSV